MTVKANWLVFARRMLAWAGCMLAAASWAAPPVPVTLRVVGGLGELNQYTQFEEPFWTKRLPEATQGRFNAEIVPFNKAGIRGQDMLSLVHQGALPMGTVLLSMGTPKDLELSAPDLAGVNPDMASLKRSMAAFRPFLQARLKERFGLELLAVYVYPAQVMFCKGPWAAEDNGLKGRRVRTSSASQSDFVQALGGTAMLTPFSEVLGQLKSGNLDCAITGTMSGNTVGLHEVTTHLHPMAINWGLSMFVANGAAWAGIPADTQTLLRRELNLLEIAIWDAAERETLDGFACNTGSTRCKGGRPGHMVALKPGAQDDPKRREVLKNTVLPNWLQRCGPACAEVWNRTLAKDTGVVAKP